MAWRVLREEKDVFVVETDRGEVRVAKSGISKGKAAKWAAMCKGGEVTAKPQKMAAGGEVKPSPDEIRKTKAPPNALKKAGEFLGERTREFTEGLVGVPGTAWGEGMNAAMAAGRSVLPGGQSYADELEKVRLAREERYPGAYSVIPEVRLPARRAALEDDSASQAMGIAAPIAFHGSPHVFNKFSMEKIGTGEGAQAYGHGLYFTSKPEVAEAYRSGLTEWKASFAPGVEWRAAKDALVQRLRAQADALWDTSRPDFKPGDSMQSQKVRRQADYMVDLAPDVLTPSSIRRIGQDYGVNVDDLVPAQQGSFHQVDLPDTLIDYDRGLAEQRPEVIAKLEAAKILPPGTQRYLELGRQMEEVGGAPLPKGVDAAAADAARRAKWDALRAEMKALDLSSGGQINFAADNLDYFLRYRYKGQDIVRDAASDPAQASARLRAAGIPGHRYKGDSSGVENYVVYDDGVIKPLGRYSSLAEYQKAKAAAPQTFAKGGEVQPYTLLDEDDATFTVEDERGPFKIAKADLSDAMLGRIRGYAKGGPVKPVPTTVDDFTAALAAYEASRAPPPVDPGALPPQIEDPRAYAPPPPTGPVVDVRTGRVVSIPAPPEPTPEQTGPILPAGGLYPPGSDPGLAMLPSHAPASVVEPQALAAHAPAPALLASHTPAGSMPTTLADGALPASAPPPASSSSSLPGAPRGVQGDIAAGRAQQAAGLQAQADAAARESEEQARILAETEQRRAVAQKDYEARLKDLQSKGDALYQNIIDKKVDPRRLWNDASLGRQVTASIGMILGGIGSALTKGPNYAVEIIDRAIQRDIEGQKAEIDKGQSLLAHNLRQTDDLRLAHQLTRADLLDSSAAQLQRAAASFAGEKAQAQAVAAIGSLRAEAAKERQAVAATAMQMAAQAELLPLQVEQAKRGAAMQRLQMEALGALLNGGGADPRMMAYLPDEIRERVVVAPGGKAYAMPTKEEAAKVRDQVQGYKEITSAVADMRRLREDLGAGGAADPAKRALAESMRRKMIGSMRLAVVGPGAMNESELKILESLIPNAGAWFTLDSVVESKLGQLEQIAYDALWSSLTGRGGFDIARYKTGGAR